MEADWGAGTTLSQIHLKVLFLSRTTLFSVPGGDTTQVMKTAEALRARGCEVTVSTEIDPDARGFDLVHLFNLTRPQETYPQALSAKKQGVPVVLSPIYVDYREYDQQARLGVEGILLKYLSPSMAQTIKIAGRMVLNREYTTGTLKLITTGYKRAQSRLLSMSSVLLPNSHSEMDRIVTDFPAASNTQHVIVPNAIDPNLFAGEPAAPISAYRDCVLCVGRIEGRKCQLELVRALNGTGINLVLIGRPAPNQTAYFDQIKREMGPNVSLFRGDSARGAREVLRIVQGTCTGKLDGNYWAFIARSGGYGRQYRHY